MALDLATGRIVASIDIDDATHRGQLHRRLRAQPRREARSYAVDQFNYRMVTVDVEAAASRESVRVGTHPFAIALSADERSAWVSNVGMFEYPLLPGVTPDNRRTAGLTFPAYGVPSKEAEEGTMAEGQSIPGLGSPNHPDAMSVFKVNLATGKVTPNQDRLPRGRRARRHQDRRRRQSRLRSSSARDRIYVSNATNDLISDRQPGTRARSRRRSS